VVWPSLFESLDIAMMGIGEWSSSLLVAAACCKSANEESFCALCCSPYLFLSQPGEGEGGPGPGPVPSNEESFSRSRSRALLLVSCALVGVACSGLLAGHKS
jgi:hypothetical protein